MSRLDVFKNVTVAEVHCSEELIKAIERNRIEMEIAWILAEDQTGVLDSATHKHLTTMSKSSKRGCNRKN
jgi:hypothetical protein